MSLFRRSFQNIIDVSSLEDHRRHSDIVLKTSDNDESDGTGSSKKGFSRLRRNLSRGSKDSLPPKYSSQTKLDESSKIKRSTSKKVPKDSLHSRFKSLAPPNDNDRVVRVMSCSQFTFHIFYWFESFLEKN